jgi:hypothetical protein
LRVKAWRRLQRIGAVPIKNSVYVLPNTDHAREDLEWVLRDIIGDGGDGSVREAKFVDGLADDEVKALFLAAREPEYEAIAVEAREVQGRFTADGSPSVDATKVLVREASRLRKRLTEVSNLDFFGASGRETAAALVGGIERQAKELAAGRRRRAGSKPHAVKPKAATWVTRTGIHVDRMASAWLIRRFIDTAATFKFVPAKGYRPAPGELRFDMFDAEFTHDRDLCTFEVLLVRFGLDDPALRAVAEIVHDIDLKDAKYSREETAGIDRVIAGIAMANADDEARLLASSPVWNGLYEYFRRKAK